MRTDEIPTRTVFLKTTGTVTMTFSDECPRIDWTGKYDPETGIATLVGRPVDPYRFDRWADDGGRAQ